MTTEFSWLPLVLQASDALFPTGAYAHSLGLEEMVRLGVVRDEASLAEFLRLHAIPALERAELPYLRFAWDAVSAGDFAEICAIDREITAWKLAREAREASGQIGVRRVKALRVISDAPVLAELERRVAAGEVRGHHLVVWAVQAVAGGVPLRAALAAYFYTSLAGACAAALKLIRIGQEGCQRVLHGACGEAERTIERSFVVTRGEAGWCGPALEIASMRHERAEERLFIS